MSDKSVADEPEGGARIESRLDARALVAALPMPAFVLGPDHTLIAYNYGCARLAGIEDTEDPLGEDFRDVLGDAYYTDQRREASLADRVVDHPDSAHETFDVERVDGEYEYTRGPVYQDTSTLLNAREEEIDIAFVAIPIVEDGDLAAVLELAEEVDPGMEEFPGLAGMLSHDLRNPLNVIQTYVELSEESIAPDHYEQIQSNIERMDRLIEDVLQLVETNQADVSIEEVHLDRIARGAWRHVDAAGATLEVDHGLVDTDPSYLQQIFENLFRNAVEHGGTDVTVRAGPLDDGVLYVADDGQGLPDEHREEIFDRGFTTTDEGTGFGLAIVRRLADDLGWEVRATDAASGGARFEIHERHGR